MGESADKHTAHMKTLEAALGVRPGSGSRRVAGGASGLFHPSEHVDRRSLRHSRECRKWK